MKVGDLIEPKISLLLHDGCLFNNLENLQGYMYTPKVPLIFDHVCTILDSASGKQSKVALIVGFEKLEMPVSFRQLRIDENGKVVPVGNTYDLLISGKKAHIPETDLNRWFKVV